MEERIMKSFWMKLAAVVIGSICVFACNDIDGPNGSDIDGIDFPFYLVSGSGIGDAHYGYLGVAASTNISSSSEGLYGTTGGFFDNTDLRSPRHDYGVATIAGKSVSAGSEMYYSESGSMSDVDAPTFGANGTWTINGGTGGPSFTKTMYVPSVIELLSPTRTGPAISDLSRSSDITVSWNSDPGNDNVLVVLFYDGAISNDIDPTLPASDEVQHWITDDDGSYTISSSDLSSLPVGGRIRIIVARGVGSNVSGGDGKNYNLYAYSTAEGAFKIIQ